MKFRPLLIGGILLAVAMGGAIALSQNLRRAHYAGAGFMNGRMLEFFADYLDLPDASAIPGKRNLGQRDACSSALAAAAVAGRETASRIGNEWSL